MHTLPAIGTIILTSFMLLHRATAPTHKKELIVVCKIIAADSSEPKCSDNNSESSDVLRVIGPPQAPGRRGL